MRENRPPPKGPWTYNWTFGAHADQQLASPRAIIQETLYSGSPKLGRDQDYEDDYEYDYEYDHYYYY